MASSHNHIIHNMKAICLSFLFDYSCHIGRYASEQYLKVMSLRNREKIQQSADSGLQRWIWASSWSIYCTPKPHQKRYQWKGVDLCLHYVKQTVASISHFAGKIWRSMGGLWPLLRMMYGVIFETINNLSLSSDLVCFF